MEQLYDNACIAAGTLDDPRVLMSRLNKAAARVAQFEGKASSHSEVLEMFIYQGAGFDYAYR